MCILFNYKEERQKMLEEIASNRSERQNKRRQQRKLQTEQFLKSMQMLQANAPDSEPFEDYSIFLYRQTAPKFEDRVKDLEKQFTYVPVSCVVFLHLTKLFVALPY
ncbi:hypothetical protein NQ314_019550 [Rhamnusium bicolor]|uniref:Uncharacterized protein n=1 Tax=Rhamnusium bicolor TaxID=1586634 RepID=A0AAV8WP45_9CUCU|nr:hypothetical protein NQ314_019550 [Rhamnusium bicolor]